MKTKILFIVIILLFQNAAKSADITKPAPQHGKELDARDIYINHHGRKISMTAITLKNVFALFGKPIKIKKEKWEVNDAKWTRTLIYPDGELVLEDNALAFATIKKSGWAFSFKNAKGFSVPFTVGTDAGSLKTLYPGSYYKTEKGFTLQIKDCDCNLYFETRGGKITSAGLFTNES